MSKPTIPPTHPHDDAEDRKARIATAWAELVEAARTDPKARAFLSAFGPEAPTSERPESDADPSAVPDESTP
jgi:hypothetical protein